MIVYGRLRCETSGYHALNTPNTGRTFWDTGRTIGTRNWTHMDISDTKIRRNGHQIGQYGHQMAKWTQNTPKWVTNVPKWTQNCQNVRAATNVPAL